MKRRRRKRRGMDGQVIQAMRWRLVLLGFGVLVVVIAVAILVVPNVSVSHVDLRYSVRISGTIVDGVTGEPVANAWIVPYRAHGDRAEAAAVKRMEKLRISHAAGRTLRGGGVSGEDGSFSFTFDIGWSARKTISGRLLVDGRPPPFHEVKALLIERPGRRTVFDAQKGTWHEDDGADVFATLIVGPVPLARQ